MKPFLSRCANSENTNDFALRCLSFDVVVVVVVVERC